MLLAFDVGAPGREGDAGVHTRSNIRTLIDNNDRLFLPRETWKCWPSAAVPLRKTTVDVLVDCGFAQGHRFVRPYKRARSDAPGKRRFNAKHSGVRRVVESTFCMLSRRFGLLQSSIQMEPSHAADVVVSLLVLHNLILGWRMQSREAEGLPSEILRELHPLEDRSQEVEEEVRSAVQVELIRVD
uniref:DDE Tnp4 domain-containing protein n=1 Tax=Haemonchus contortus TaxID=6289 RepID=A0A7I5ED34_HAECO